MSRLATSAIDMDSIENPFDEEVQQKLLGQIPTPLWSRQALQWSWSSSSKVVTSQRHDYGAYSHLIPRDHGFSASRKQA